MNFLIVKSDGDTLPAQFHDLVPCTNALRKSKPAAIFGLCPNKSIHHQVTFTSVMKLVYMIEVLSLPANHCQIQINFQPKYKNIAKIICMLINLGCEGVG